LLSLALVQCPIVIVLEYVHYIGEVTTCWDIEKSKGNLLSEAHECGCIGCRNYLALQAFKLLKL